MALRLCFDLGLTFMNSKEVFTRTFVNLIGVPLEPTLICHLFCILFKKKETVEKPEHLSFNQVKIALITIMCQCWRLQCERLWLGVFGARPKHIVLARVRH